jgi:hypothetical protein
MIIVAMSHQAVSQNCRTKVVSSSTTSILGVQTLKINIMNLNVQAFDRIDYRVTSYDVYGENLGSEDFFWQPGYLTHPIKNGETLHDIQTSKMKGAKTIDVNVNRVHFIDGKSCGR